MRSISKVLFLAAIAYMMAAPFLPENEVITVKENPVQHKPGISGKPDFTEFSDVVEKKRAFFAYLKPSIDEQNQRILEERAKLTAMQQIYAQSGHLNKKQLEYCRRLGRLYLNKVTKETLSDDWFAQMLRKVEVIPPALILTQAANESAWGTSRFATQGNNYFGQWCYKKGCGLVPLQRAEGASHEVAKFDSVAGSVRAYFMNVNRNSAYQAFRLIRQQLKQQGYDLLSTKSAIALTQGLMNYSERGQNYVDDLQMFINANLDLISASTEA